MWKIKGHTLEFIESEHIYLCDGVILPSVTQLLHSDKYKNVSAEVLNRAAERGTAVHKAIQNYCENEEKSDLKELRNFLFLKRNYNFDVEQCEVPILIFKDEKPVVAGRLDLILKCEGKLGIADIKTTSKLDKIYLANQLNLYRIGYEQSYDTEISFLKGIHLKNDTRKYVDIPIDEIAVQGYLNECKVVV